MIIYSSKICQAVSNPRDGGIMFLAFPVASLSVGAAILYKMLLRNQRRKPICTMQPLLEVVESIPTLAYVLDRCCAIGSILRYIHTSERRHVCVNTGPLNKSHLTLTNNKDKVLFL